jgi:hypothetical protein
VERVVRVVVVVVVVVAAGVRFAVVRVGPRIRVFREGFVWVWVVRVVRGAAARRVARGMVDR